VWPPAGDLLFSARLQLVSRFASSSAIGHPIFKGNCAKLFWKIKVKIISILV
jgi:hypothetical protein